MNVQFSLVIVIALGCVVSLEAVCCKRKGNFGCCGNGPCNIFCCHCDGGCNEICEKTHCSTGEWFKCAGVVATCAAACAVPEDPACVACLGPLYDTCKKCYSGVDVKKALDDTKYVLNSRHKEKFCNALNIEDLTPVIKENLKEEEKDEL